MCSRVGIEQERGRVVPHWKGRVGKIGGRGIPGVRQKVMGLTTSRTTLRQPNAL